MSDAVHRPEREYAWYIAQQCKSKADWLNDRSRKFRAARSVLRVFNVVIALSAAIAEIAEAGFLPHVDASPARILVFLAAGTLIISTAYFTLFQEQSPETMRDVAITLHLHASRIAQLLASRAKDAALLLRDTVSSASLALASAQARWPAASSPPPKPPEHEPLPRAPVLPAPSASIEVSRLKKKPRHLNGRGVESAKLAGARDT